MVLFVTYLTTIFAKDGKILNKIIKSSIYISAIFNFPEGTCDIDQYDEEL